MSKWQQLTQNPGLNSPPNAHSARAPCSRKARCRLRGARPRGYLAWGLHGPMAKKPQRYVHVRCDHVSAPQSLIPYPKLAAAEPGPQPPAPVLS